MPTSYQPEVHVEGGWSANALRFATLAEAQSYAADLMQRWTLVRDSRAVPSHDLVNYRWEPATRLLTPVAAPG